MLATLDPRLLTAQAAQRAEQGNAGFSLPEIFRARGVTLFAYGAARDLSLSEEYLREAFVIAKRNDSPSWALRAATSLLTLKMNSPGASEAADLVNNVLAGFSQGQRTRDHVNARHLLEAMSSQRREHPARSPLLPSNSFSSSH
jgi:hypothetical protein